MVTIRVLIAGDTHGELPWCERLVKYAVKQKIKTILQVGDFGYWPHRNNGQTFLTELSKALVAAGIKWYWVDGNHENFDWLDAEGAFGADSMQETYPNIIYIPRGHRWEWDGVPFLGLGGAASIDKHWRVPGDSWWAKECISMAEAEKAIQGGHADIMVTHDSPMVEVPIEGLLMDHEASNQNREALRKVVDEVKPRLLFHGHYHHRFSADHGPTHIEALGKNGDGAKGFCVLHLPSLNVVHPRDW